MSSVSTRLPDNPPSTDRPNPARAALFDWFVARPRFEAVEWPTLIAGHPVAASYCETFWLPVIGPTAYLTARRLTDWIDGGAGQTTVDLVELGSCMGVGTGTSRHTSINRTLIRLHDFSLVRQQADRLEVRLIWPALPPQHRRKLTDGLRDELTEWEANR